MSGILLAKVDSINDLDILFDSKPTFSSHCHKVAAKGLACVNAAEIFLFLMIASYNVSSFQLL